MVPLLATRLGLSPTDLVVHQVTAGEPQPRNLPPMAFSPPQQPPNHWVNRTVAITLARLGTAEPPACAQVT